jgi:hypothetical protein
MNHPARSASGEPDRRQGRGRELQEILDMADPLQPQLAHVAPYRVGSGA